jgi:hypothetical protein
MANEFKVKKGLIVDGTGTVLDVQGTQGQLFSITDSLTGDIFAVSDISGVPILTVNSSGAVDIDGTLTVSTISSATTDTDKFLVSDAGGVKYRTGAEVLSDIGAQAAGSYAAASHTHSASNITSGTFSAGHYIFPYQSGVTGATAPNYTQGSIEIYTDSNHVPAIGFHRSGQSATTLYEYDGQLYANAWTTRAQTGLLLSTGNIGSYAAAVSHTHAASDITSGTFADARIALSNITQHTDPKYLRSDAADTATGEILFDAGFKSDSILLSGAQNFDNISRSGFYNLYNTNTGSTNSPGFPYGTMIVVGGNKVNNAFGLQIAHERENTGMYVRGMNDSGSTWSSWAEIWTSATDGSGSGLDADLLDGQQGSYYLAWGNLTGVPSTFTPSAHTLDSHSNVTITSNSSGEILKWSGSAWINNTLAEAGIAAASHTHSASDITSGTLDTARLPEFIEERYIYNSNDSNGVFMPMVKGGLYATTAGTVTGAIKVTLPSYKSNMMFTIYVDIYEYATGETVTFRVSGYAYGDAGATWHSCSVVNLADNTDRNYTVRFYSDTTNNAQYFTIGETNSAWSYPQVNLRDFLGGYETSEYDALGEWNVEFVTSFTGDLRHTFTDNFVAADWDGIRDKPSTFTPSSHTHDDRYYTETEIGNFFSGATSITGYSKTNWDSAYTHSQAAHAPSNATVNSTDATLLARANHTGTQLYSTISNPPTIPSGNQIIDWTQAGAGTIHTDNYIENVVQTTVSGNAGTVTNGVYTVDNQTIGGTKTFSSAIYAPSGNSTQWNTAYTDRNKWDGGATGLTASTGRASLGGTTLGQSMFILTNPSAITFPRFNANNTVSALSASDFRTAIGAGTGGGDVSGSGAAGQVTFWNGTSSVTGENDLYWDSANNELGIGTNNPNYSLHVVASDPTLRLDMGSNDVGTVKQKGGILSLCSQASNTVGGKIEIISLTNSSSIRIAEFENTGRVQLEQYGSGSFTGTAAKMLAVTDTGIVVEETLPTVTSVAATSGGGISISGSPITTSGTLIITNTDKGSSQAIFKNVAVSGQSWLVADTNNDTLTLATQTGLKLLTNATTDTITYSPQMTVMVTSHMDHSTNNSASWYYLPFVGEVESTGTSLASSFVTPFAGYIRSITYSGAGNGTPTSATTIKYTILNNGSSVYGPTSALSIGSGTASGKNLQTSLSSSDATFTAGQRMSIQIQVPSPLYRAMFSIILQEN